MCELSSLLRNGPGHLWTSVPHIHRANTACKINVTVTIYIFADTTISLGSKHVQRRTHAPRYKLLPPRPQGARFLSGNMKRWALFVHRSLLIGKVTATSSHYRDSTIY